MNTINDIIAELNKRIDLADRPIIMEVVDDQTGFLITCGYVLKSNVLEVPDLAKIIIRLKTDYATI